MVAFAGVALGVLNYTAGPAPRGRRPGCRPVDPGRASRGGPTAGKPLKNRLEERSPRYDQ